jgi:hypothetical protein
LVFFRIAFGVLASLQVYKFWGLTNSIVRSGFRIPWDYFEWIEPLPLLWNNWFFGLGVCAGMLLAFGVLYRLSALILSISIFYTVLLDVGIYNNHYYVFALVSLLFLVTNANAKYSIDNVLFGSGRRVVPRWHLFMFQFTIGIVYLFGAIAKINPDWLFHAQPVATWLPNMLPSVYESLSANDRFYVALFLSWSGFLIDLFVPFALFHRKWKLVAFVVLLLFHSTNFFMFDIGYFPLFGIVSLVLFCDPWLSKRFGVPNSDAPPLPLNKLAFGFVILWMGFHLLFPLRRHLMPGDYRWTGSAYMFSWTMKLTDHEPIIRFEGRINGEQPFTIEYADVLYQQHEYVVFIMSSAWRIVWFSNKCEEWLKEEHPRLRNKDIQVYCDSYVSLNGRPFQRKVDPNVDLTKLSLHPIKKYFSPQSWIVPLGSDSLIDRETLDNLLAE